MLLYIPLPGRDATILDCWVISGISQSYVRHTGPDHSDYVAILDDATLWHIASSSRMMQLGARPGSAILSGVIQGYITTGTVGV